MARNIFVSVFVLMVGLLLISCSKNNGSDIDPIGISSDCQTHDFTFSEELSSMDSRSMVGAWIAEIDLTNREFRVEPLKRDVDYHFNLNAMFPNVLSVVSYHFGKPFTADIKLRHPFPGSGIDGFDPRVIAVLPANDGVSASFPALDVLMNDSALLNPDGCTKLWDSLSLPGNTNPFIAYFKDEPYRVWSSIGHTEDTQRWEIDLNGFGGSMQFLLVVDVSTGFPNPPSPGVDNATEPFQIDAEIGEGLIYSGGEADIRVTVHDWQGQTGNDGVWVEAPDLFDGTLSLNFDYSGPPDSNEYYYSGSIPNSLLAAGGDYDLLVAARDISSGIYIYNKFRASVVGLPMNMVAFGNLRFAGSIIHADARGNYAYACDGSYFYVVYISPSEDVYIVKSVPVSGYDVKADGEYAYIPAGSEFKVIDINPPTLAHEVKSVALPGSAWNIDIDKEYAYVSQGSLYIVNINPIESAYVVKSVSDCGAEVSVQNGYAYLAWGNQVNVVDVDPPENAAKVKTVDLPDSNLEATDLYALNDYLYVSDKFSYPDPSYGLEIISINPPETAYIVNTLYTTGWEHGVCALDGYAFVVDWYGMYVADVDPPGSVSIISSVSTYERAVDVCTSGRYAFVSNSSNGLTIVRLW